MEEIKEEKKIFMPDFLVIPHQIIMDKNLSPTDGYVYGVVYMFSQFRNERCTAHNRTIANILNVKTQSVANSLVKLAKRKYIDREFYTEDENKIRVIIPLIRMRRSYGKQGKSNEDNAA